MYPLRLESDHNVLFTRHASKCVISTQTWLLNISETLSFKSLTKATATETKQKNLNKTKQLSFRAQKFTQKVYF